MKQEFRFETYEQVKVVDSGKQYSTHWEAYGKLMHGCEIGAWGNSFIIGAHLNDENLENTVFQIVARDRVDENNLYLIISQSDYEDIKSREICEKEKPVKIFVIEEAGLCSSKKEKEKLFAVYLSFEPFNIDSEPSQADPEDLRIYGKKVGLEEVAPYPNGVKVYVLAETEEKGREIAKKAFRKYLEDRTREMGEEEEE